MPLVAPNDKQAKGEKKGAEYWKDKFFKKYPEADTDKDGKLSWPELKKHKEKSK